MGIQKLKHEQPEIILTLNYDNAIVRFASNSIVQSKAELEKVYDENAKANWAIWQSLSRKEQLELNKAEGA